MPTISPVIDPSREMEERAWWDLWNTSHRAKDDLDSIAAELFTRATAAIDGLPGAAGRSILEVACGTGALSRLLQYSSYHGLDISPAAIEIARQKAKSRVLSRDASVATYEAADFHNWPALPEAFDLVVCIDAISSIRDQQLALQKMAEALKPSGMLVLTTINKYVYERIRRTPNQPLSVGPVSHWLTRTELRSLIQSAGLTIERFETIMPRGNLGILRLINSWRLNQAIGSRGALMFRRLKERAGLGQYFLVAARKARKR